MTDQEFQRLLKRNLTITADYKANWGNPYIEIKLELIPDKDDTPTSLGSIRIYATDLQIEE